MTAMPEAKLAEAEIAYAVIALVTDYDSWRAKPPEAAANDAQLLAEIIANLSAAAKSAVTLMRKTIELMSSRREELMGSAALRALDLAIWSDKSKISADDSAPSWAAVDKVFRGNRMMKMQKPAFNSQKSGDCARTMSLAFPAAAFCLLSLSAARQAPAPGRELNQVYVRDSGNRG